MKCLGRRDNGRNAGQHRVAGIVGERFRILDGVIGKIPAGLAQPTPAPMPSTSPMRTMASRLGLKGFSGIPGRIDESEAFALLLFLQPLGHFRFHGFLPQVIEFQAGVGLARQQGVVGFFDIGGGGNPFFVFPGGFLEVGHLAVDRRDFGIERRPVGPTG